MSTRAIMPIVILAAMLAASCAAPAAEPSGAMKTAKGIEAEDVNRGVEACTDFYEYANGAWRAQHPIPDGKPRWSRRSAGREANRQKVRALLQELASKTSAAGSAEQLVGDHYAACIDEKAGESAGLTPIAPLLADIDAMKTPADVQRVIRRLHDLGIAAAFGEAGAYDNSDPKDFRLNLIASGLPLGDRDAYLKNEKPAMEAREKYRQRVARTLGLAGVAPAATRAASDDVIALETRLAEASLDAKTAADPAATEHKTTFAQLKDMAPHVDWDTYFNEARIPRDDVNVAEQKLLRQVDKELTATPVAVWKTYLKWQLLDTASPWLSKEFADPATEAKPRAERCVELTETLLGEPIGKVYAERYFTPAAKAKAREIANGLVAVLKEDMSGLAWMTPDTKKQAIEKLTTMSVQVGYPDRWKDLSSVHIRRDALWANIAEARTFNVNDVRRQIGKPTDRNSWLLAPSSPDAYLDPVLNELVLPAGFLQPPYFDIEATDAVNYGSLGAGLAHDMTHSFDATGAAFDVTGHAKNWWTDGDKTAFQQRAQCIVDQYESYAIEPGVHHQGKLVLNEALGDQAGLHFAYLALKRSMATHPVPTVDGFTPEQQFFLAWGQFRGEAVRIEAQRQIVKSDIHAVPKFRVIGPLSNLPEFAEAFSCKAGTPMVRPQEQRCAVW